MAPGRCAPPNRGVFCPISFEGNMHKLHIYVHRKDFRKLNNSTQDQSIIVSLDYGNPRCKLTGSGRLFVVVNQLSRSSTEEIRQYMCQNSAGSDVSLFCTSDFIEHYGISKNMAVFLEQVSPNTIEKMVLSVSSEKAFEWANQKLFSTGLLINVCDQRVLVRKGDCFLTPYSSLFAKDCVFTMDMLYDICVRDCIPVRQGILSINTEILIIRQNDEDTDPLGSQEILVKPLLISDFTCGITNHDATDFLRHNPESAVSPLLSLLTLNFTCTDPMHSADADFLPAIPKYLVENVDEQCLIFMDEDLMAEFGLFEKCFVIVGVATKDPQGFGSDTNKNSRDLNDEKTSPDNIQIKQHVAVVTSNANVPSNSRCLLSPVLWHNIGGNCVAHEKKVSIKKWQPTEESLPSYSVTAEVPYAQQIRISLVHSPKYLPTVQLDQLLQAYFSKTRYLSEGDIICLDTNEDLEFYQNHEDVVTHHKPVVYYKVTQITSTHKSQFGYKVDVQHTTLYQDAICHSLVPAFMDPATCACPGLPGLQNYVDQLTTLVQPYLAPSKSDSRQLATFLLTGSVACGKTAVISQVAARHSMHLMQVDCGDLCGDTPAASEARIKATLHRAVSFWPCVLLLKNLHVMGKDREGQGQDARVSTAFLEMLKQTLLTEATSGPVVVIATTSSIKQLNSDLQEGFLHQIHMESPSEHCRFQMLQSLLKDTDLDSTVSLSYIAQRTAGFVLGDLCALVSQVKQATLKRISVACFGPRGMPTLRQEQELVWSGFSVQPEDFTDALDSLQSAHSEAIGAPKIPNIRWADIGGLASVKDEILDTIQLPLEHPELFAAGLRRSGVLLYGPPGTGKTLLAKAVATECSLNFLSVKGPELINMYVGQSEENVREVFSRAREASPCVIFFDELDSLAPNRGRSGDSGGVMDRVVSQLLAELDGLHRSCDVFVIGATNRPDLLDPALLRPGRYDKLLYVGVSEDKDSQLNILQALTRKFSLGPDCDLSTVVEQCPMNMTGADFYALCSDAMLNALKHKIERLEQGDPEDQSAILVSQADFLAALSSLVPSISTAELDRYRSIQTSYKNRK